MKRCPSCNLTFADTETYCLKDGAPLTSAVASYDAQATMMAPPQQQQQQAYYPNQSPQSNQTPPQQWPQQQPSPGWQYNQPSGQNVPYVIPQTQRTGTHKGFAITSMILGLIGLVGSMFWLGGIIFLIFALTRLLSIIFGIIALLKAVKNPAHNGGKGFAIAGIVFSLLGEFVFVVIQFFLYRY